MTRRISTLEIFTDGACSGNPGPAAIGVVIKKRGQTIKEISRSIGEATNNIAEYTALIYGLQEALILKAQVIDLYTDSELMHKQMVGQYKVKHDGIKPLFDQAQHLLTGFTQVKFHHVPREKNREADKLATSAVKKSKPQWSP